MATISGSRSALIRSAKRRTPPSLKYMLGGLRWNWTGYCNPPVMDGYGQGAQRFKEIARSPEKNGSQQSFGIGDPQSFLLCSKVNFVLPRRTTDIVFEDCGPSRIVTRYEPFLQSC